jgi:hypothetical protein
MSVRVGAITVAASFISLALIPSRPVDLFILREVTSISLNSNVELNCGSSIEENMFDDNFCLILFAKVCPILVRKVLKRDDIDCKFLVSTLSDVIYVDTVIDVGIGGL